MTTDKSAYNEGDTVILSGSFADPGKYDGHTVTIAWADGSTPTVQKLGPGVTAFMAAHRYLSNNTGSALYAATVMVTVDAPAK